MRTLLSFLFMTIVFISCRHKDPVEYNYIDLIPQPQHFVAETGVFKINPRTSIVYPESLDKQGNYLKSLIESKCKFELPREKEGVVARNRSIILELNPEYFADSSGFANYHLEIMNKYVHLIGKDEEAISMGIQTLLQMFPVEFHSEDARAGQWEVRTGVIDDYADFKHRGMLLDCCRHFFSKDVVKKYIDLLAFYKMNTLHWHLTEDQGWRIESERWPKLNTIASRRTEPDGSVYSGLYSKDDIREIIQYADQRGITIIPEIEMPGHSQAALAAYPQFSCVGHDIEVANDWGVFKEIYCAGNDSTFVFLESVLDEVIELFPSEYIHIGGDEAPKTRWEECEKCQKRIKDEGLEDEHQLQSWFIRKTESYLNSKGRKLIGWDEILEGGLTQNATVQSWRGFEGGIEAVSHGNQAIMSPTSHCYFDYDLKSTDMEEVYHFNPIPEEISANDRHYIIGGECNMWTEHVPDEETLDSKVFPRLLAMSEVLWNNPGNKATEKYEDFVDRVLSNTSFLEAKNVSYGLMSVPVKWELSSENLIQISSDIPDARIFARWICDTCLGEPIQVDKTLELDRDGKLELILKSDYWSGTAEVISFELHEAISHEVATTQPYSEWYTAGGENGLTNGIKGSYDFRDGNWQGYWGDDLIATIDLGESINIHSVSCTFYQYINSWIFAPEHLQVEISDDSLKWSTLGEYSPEILTTERGKHLIPCTVKGSDTEARFVRVSAKNIGKVPDWHEASGSDAWIFIDEIAIE